MKNKIINLAACAALAALSSQAGATTVLGSLPGWTLNGNGGYQTSTDGVVDVAPGQTVDFVTTNGGSSNNNLGSPGTNGSTATSAFTATAGEALTFSFKFVTSDGSGFPDYAWAEVFQQGSSTPTAVLFTAATNPTLGATVPASDLPGIPITATLTPAVGSIPFTAGGPVWSALGSWSGACYAAGCGYTGWVDASYTIAAAGNYNLVFGVANANDTAYDTGLAWKAAAIGGTPIGDGNVPEPAMLSLLGIGFAGFSIMRRHRNSKV
jgi:hypothetical protein